MKPPILPAAADLADVPVEQLPAMLAALASLQSAIAARLLTIEPEPPGLPAMMCC